MTHTKINHTHSGPRGWTKTLIEQHGEQQVREYWIEHGNRKTADHFGVPVSTIDHLKVKHNWKRPMDKVPQVLWGIARGNTHPSNYPHLIFKMPISAGQSADKDMIRRHAYYLLKKGTFYGWCILNHDYPLCKSIYLWFRGDSRTDWVESYVDVIDGMKSHGLIRFEQRHFDEVEKLHEKYKQQDPEFRFEGLGKPQHKKK